ncbi:MAG: hypothetical protein ACYCW6_10610 [Candidatus Xenobia bacterium]
MRLLLCDVRGANITRQAPLFLLSNSIGMVQEIPLQSLVGLEIEEIHTRHGSLDVVTLHVGKRPIAVPIDNLVPIGSEWDDWWTDFDEFLEDGDEADEVAPDDVIMLGDLLGARIDRVRTGASPKGERFVMLDLDLGMSLLMPLRDLGKCSGYEDLYDEDVSAGIADV